MIFQNPIQIFFFNFLFTFEDLHTFRILIAKFITVTISQIESLTIFHHFNIFVLELKVNFLMVLTEQT